MSTTCFITGATGFVGSHLAEACAATGMKNPLLVTDKGLANLPITQATLDLVLYVLFFIPGVIALTWAGWTYAADSWAIQEHTFNADPLPLYPFKSVIPLAGLVVLMQGLSEILRCVVCIRTGAWTPRLKDADEIDVAEQQLASSVYVDDEARQQAIANAKNIEESAHQRAKGGQA